MEEINNFNFEGKCQQTGCDKKYTQSEIITLYGVETIVCFCDENAGVWEKNFWGTPRETRLRVFPEIKVKQQRVKE